MKKLKRAIKGYGNGSGKTTYQSNIFRVISWTYENGIVTEIECFLNIFLILRFEGEHTFISDEECFYQLTFDEFLKIIEVQKEYAYLAGKEDKLTEIRNVLEL